MASFGTRVEVHRDPRQWTSVVRRFTRGIEIFAGFIVGFDHDTVETFERQHKFIIESGIQVAMVGMLTALPRTPLYTRLAAEGRLVGEDTVDNTRLSTNVMPKQMTMDDMRTGYQNLYRRLLSDRGIGDRIREKLRHLVTTGGETGYPLRSQLTIAARLLVRGVRPGGWRRWWHFMRTTVTAKPSQIPVVMSDWIAGLSMREYAHRYLLAASEAETRIMERCTAKLRKTLRRWIDDGALDVTCEMPNLSMTLRRVVDSSALAQASRQLRRLLRKTKSTITLHVESCDARSLEHLLRRLARYGDRVSLSVAETLRDAVDVDWSRFEVVLET